MTETTPNAEDVLAMLLRRGVITTDPAVANWCCGTRRDENGFCIHRLSHPIYVRQYDGEACGNGS